MTSKTTRTRFGALGTVLVVGGFGVTGGLPGLLAAAVVGVSWYVLPSVAAFAIGQFALVALVSPEKILVLLVAEIGLLGILLDPTTDTSRPVRVTAAVAGCVALGAVGSWAGYHWLDSIWQVTTLLGVTATVAAYGLHRYERIALGLVTDAPIDNHE